MSGFHLLTSGKDALDWRLALVDHATTSIDIQYYIWDRDHSGRLLFARLLDAADRGVRIRLLVDDFKFAGQDAGLAAISHHPNIEVRLFNPQFVRTGILRPTLEFAFRFDQLNRRMHNKLLVVDNQLAILGGRNIGDVYFGLGETYNFIDLDVLVAGDVIPSISDAFDEFWNSDPAYPGEAIAPWVGPEQTAPTIARLRDEITAQLDTVREAGYPVERKDWSADLTGLHSRWHGGTAIMIGDDPVVKPGENGSRLMDDPPSLTDEENPQEILFVSPYLIPRESLIEGIAERTARGAEVRLLTPGMASTDLPLVHSHYKKYRRPLLAAGTTLHELRAQPSEELRDFSDTDPNRPETVSLHLKGGVGDRKRCFIGSLNLDPRSLEINTEAGLFIESPSLSEELAVHLETLMATENAWLVSTTGEDGTGQLRWESGEEEKTIQPAKNFTSRLLDLLMGLLPVEDLL